MRRPLIFLAFPLLAACDTPTVSCPGGDPVIGAYLAVEEEHRDDSGTPAYGWLDATFSSLAWRTLDAFNPDEPIAALDLPDCSVPGLVATAPGDDEGATVALGKRTGAGYIGSFDPTVHRGSDYEFAADPSGDFPGLTLPAGELPPLVQVAAALAPNDSGGVDVSWAAGTASDVLWLSLTHTETEERLVWEVIDDGAFAVPPSALSSWPLGRMLVGLSNSAVEFVESDALDLNAFHTATSVVELER